MNHPRFQSIARGIAVVLFAAILSGCFFKKFDIRSPSGSANATKAKFEPVRDVPIPSNSKLDNDRSLILNTADKWTGRIVLEAEPPMSKLFTYYGTEMRKLGWVPVARVMGETSVLTFLRGERVVTVQIEPNMMTEGSVVTVTMSPRDPDHHTDIVPVARETHAAPAYTQEIHSDGRQERSVQAERLPPLTYPAQTSTRYRR